MRTPPNSSCLIQTYSKLLCTIFLSLIFSLCVFSQSVDPNFNPVASSPGSFSGGFTFQPDGKIVIYGSFSTIQGVQKNGIARLNADGSLDNSLDCATCEFFIQSVLVQPDGKILIGGLIPIGDGFYDQRLRRLNADGSIDSTFASPFPPVGPPAAAENAAGILGIQPDGMIFVYRRTGFLGNSTTTIYRLNPNGTIDSTFSGPSFVYNAPRFSNKEILGSFKLLPDGKLLVGGKHSFGSLFRLNSNGTKDNSFQAAIVSDPNPDVIPYINDADIQADGKIPLLGSFSAINSTSKAGMARLNADQSLETSYTFPLALTTSTPQQIRALKLLSNDKLLVSGPLAGGKRLVRLNTDGSLDNSFNAPANLTTIRGWKVDAGEKILVSADFTGEGSKLARLNADGSRDLSFADVSVGVASTVSASAVLSNGKIVIGGDFSRINNIPRQKIARLNADSSLDPAFDPGTGFNGSPTQLAAQPDGKILAIGSFNLYNGTPRDGFARINPDGSLDTAFNPTVTDVSAIAVQADGKILIGGNFSTVNGAERTGFARLNADGSLDNSFNPVFDLNAVYAILIQPDGKIMAGGFFSTVNGMNYQKLARFNPDGSLDLSFGTVNNTGVRIIARQTDGKYLISDHSQIYRRNVDGSVDASFQSISFGSSAPIRAIVAQSDGTILVGGIFISVNNDRTKGYLVRLAPNGTLQTDFLPGGTNGPVYTLSKQADNKVIVGGTFSFIGGTGRIGIARLTAPVVRKTLFDYDGDGRSDVSVFRPVENKWFILRSSDLGITQQIFAIAGDIPVPADYDGDGKTDFAVFRPSSGDWWYLSSINNAQINVHFGQAGDIPKPSDFDGDGKTDFVVYRPSNSNWYKLSSTGQTSFINFGIAEDKPLIGDFDGDGKTEPAIFRPSTGDWWYASSISGQFIAVHWGASGDIPVPGDYDADGKTDFVVFRPSDGGWYILYSSGSYTIATFGTVGDKPIAADYDGDGKTDIAVWRPSTGTWYLLQTTSGFGAVNFGVATDIPTENAFVQ